MTRLPKANGLFETHLTVSDLGRSIAFYRDLVGLPLALDLPERGAAFFWIGGRGEAMLGLWSLGSAPMGLSLHIALRASLEDVLGACDALASVDVEPLSFFGSPTTEPSVIGWMPAVAVYFRDPDGHLIEYLAMLEEPPRPERGSSRGRSGRPAPSARRRGSSTTPGRATTFDRCSRRRRTPRRSSTPISARARSWSRRSATASSVICSWSMLRPSMRTRSRTWRSSPRSAAGASAGC
jgi:lactoylglutathione lyase